MLAVAAVGVALGALRSALGPVFALAAGGVIGCGLAPWLACRGMRTLDRELIERDGPLPRNDPRQRDRATLLAESYVLIWAAWYLAGVVVAAMGVALAYWLRTLALIDWIILPG